MIVLLLTQKKNNKSTQLLTQALESMLSDDNEQVFEKVYIALNMIRHASWQCAPGRVFYILKTKYFY